MSVGLQVIGAIAFVGFVIAAIFARFSQAYKRGPGRRGGWDSGSSDTSTNDSAGCSGGCGGGGCGGGGGD